MEVSRTPKILTSFVITYREFYSWTDHHGGKGLLMSGTKGQDDILQISRERKGKIDIPRICLGPFVSQIVA
jgi:hypothetical protein